MDAWDELPEEKKGKGPPKVAKVSVFDLLNNNLLMISFNCLVSYVLFRLFYFGH